MLEDDNTASQTYELYGPTNFSMAEIAELVDKEIYKRRRHINVPKFMMQPAAKILNQLLWWKTTSADEIEREFIDQVIDPKAKTFKDLGMTPADLRNFTFHYLVSPFLPECAMVLIIMFYSKGIEAPLSTICRRQRSERREKRRSICMSSTINDLWAVCRLLLSHGPGAWTLSVYRYFASQHW